MEKEAKREEGFDRIFEIARKGDFKRASTLLSHIKSEFVSSDTHTLIAQLIDVCCNHPRDEDIKDFIFKWCLKIPIEKNDIVKLAEYSDIPYQAVRKLITKLKEDFQKKEEMKREAEDREILAMFGVKGK